MRRRNLVAICAGLGMIVVLRVGQLQADGPLGPIQGGPLRTGQIVLDADVDWAGEIGPLRLIEFQLVDPPHSRTTVAFVHDGALYVVCDRGYIWRRLPRARMRLARRLMYALRTWPDEALLDGRAVVRLRGKRYLRQAVRVTDSDVLESLREIATQAAREHLSEPLLAVPQDPESIWFFRLDPRLELTPG